MSGGPTSGEGKAVGDKAVGGKAVSKWNATRHGISSPAPVVPGLETEEDWSHHRTGVIESLTPVGALESNLAERVAIMLWRLARVTRYETGMLSEGQARVEDDLHDHRRMMLSLEERRGLSVTHPEDIRFEVKNNRDILSALKRYVNTQRGTDKVVRGTDVSHVMHAFYLECRKRSVEDFDIDDLELAAIPDTHDIYEPPKLPAGDLERCLKEIASAAGAKDVTETLQATIESAEISVRTADVRLENSEREVARLGAERILADHKTLEKVQKYESHLSRQLYHAMHELENLQSHRKEGKGTPLARIDVQGLEAVDG